MASVVKKTTFDEYYQTLYTMTKHIELQFDEVKNRQKKLLVWKGHDSFKDFLKDIERKAIKATMEELSLSESAIRDRWYVLTLPSCIYFSLEDGSLSFSKAKFLTAINLDAFSDSDCKLAEELVDEIKKGISNDEIKELVKKNINKVWNQLDIVMIRLAEQSGITQSTLC